MEARSWSMAGIKGSAAGLTLMTTSAKIGYWIGLILCLAMTIYAVVIGWWLAVVLALLFMVMYAVAAPFVLGRRWRPRPPSPTRRPVVRRRR